MSFAILTDTSANLPTPLLEKHGITVVPFSYSYDGAEHICLDTETFDGAAYYGAMRKGTVVTTSLVNPGRFIAAARPLLAAGKDILFVGMSSGISGSFVMLLLGFYGTIIGAVADLNFLVLIPFAIGCLIGLITVTKLIKFIDTLGASLGEGILVLRAIEMRESGASLSETAAALRDMRWRMYQIFTVDDIMYLRRTGRLSNAKAIVASVLHIKPLLKGNEEGRIVAVDKIRGRRKAIDALVERYRKYVVAPETQTVGIAHADCAEDAEYLVSALRIVAPPKEIMTVMYEPVTGSHVGPGALALFFLGDENVRSK